MERVDSQALIEQLHLSICLLTLLTKRPSNLDELNLDQMGKDDSNGPQEPNASADLEIEETHLEDDMDGFEDILVEHSKEHLRDKVLDRLAETLARYKTVRTGGGGPVLDSKHVSSTMMVVDEQHNRVRILCPKNEGLDQDGSPDDTAFLEAWRVWMERISKQGENQGEDQSAPYHWLLTCSRKYNRRRQSLHA